MSLSTSVNDIKKYAKEIKKAQRISHGQALELASKHFGFNSYFDARKVILNRNLDIYFCMDVKVAIDYDDFGTLVEPVDYQYLTDLYIYHKNKTNDDLRPEEFRDGIDNYLIFHLLAKDVKSYEEAHAKISEIFFFSPMYLIHEFEFVEVNNYDKTDIVRFFQAAKTTDREKAFGKSSGTLWCLHCERTYQEGEYRNENIGGDIHQMCPYEDCDGDTVVDAWDWESLLDKHPEYPKIPEKGNKYPLYP